MLYSCQLIDGNGQPVTGTSLWVVKSYKMHKVGDLLLAVDNAYGLCILSIIGICSKANLESAAIPAVYNTLELYDE